MTQQQTQEPRQMSRDEIIVALESENNYKVHDMSRHGVYVIIEPEYDPSRDNGLATIPKAEDPSFVRIEYVSKWSLDHMARQSRLHTLCVHKKIPVKEFYTNFSLLVRTDIKNTLERLEELAKSREAQKK